MPITPKDHPIWFVFPPAPKSSFLHSMRLPGSIHELLLLVRKALVQEALDHYIFSLQHQKLEPIPTEGLSEAFECIANQLGYSVSKAPISLPSTMSIEVWQNIIAALQQVFTSRYTVMGVFWQFLKIFKAQDIALVQNKQLTRDQIVLWLNLLTGWKLESAEFITQSWVHWERVNKILWTSVEKAGFFAALVDKSEEKRTSKRASSYEEFSQILQGSEKPSPDVFNLFESPEEAAYCSFSFDVDGTVSSWFHQLSPAKKAPYLTRMLKQLIQEDPDILDYWKFLKPKRIEPDFSLLWEGIPHQKNSHLEQLLSFVNGYAINKAPRWQPAMQDLKFIIYYRYPKFLAALLNLKIITKADLQRTDEAGNTLLHFAASKIRIEQVKLLLLCGADPHTRNLAGKTAAELTDHTRIQSYFDQHARDHEQRKRLIEQDWDPSQDIYLHAHPLLKWTDGSSLMTAAKFGRLEAVKLLIAKAAALNLWDIGNPLEVTRISPLLELGNAEGIKVLNIAIVNLRFSVARILLSNTDLEHSWQKEFFPFLTRGDTQATQSFIDCLPENQLSHFGFFAAEQAVISDQPKLFSFLFKTRLSPFLTKEVSSVDGVAYSLIFSAIKNNNPTFLAILRQHGVNFNLVANEDAEDDDVETILEVAIAQGNPEILQLLLNYYPFDDQDKGLRAAIKKYELSLETTNEAAQRAAQELIRILCSKVTYNMPKSQNDYRVHTFLMFLAAKIKRDCRQAFADIIAGKKEVDFSHIPVNAENEQGDTFLTVAIDYGRDDLVEILEARGAWEKADLPPSDFLNSAPEQTAHRSDIPLVASSAMLFPTPKLDDRKLSPPQSSSSRETPQTFSTSEPMLTTGQGACAFHALFGELHNLVHSKTRELLIHPETGHPITILFDPRHQEHREQLAQTIHVRCISSYTGIKLKLVSFIQAEYQQMAAGKKSSTLREQDHSFALVQQLMREDAGSGASMSFPSISSKLNFQHLVEYATVLPPEKEDQISKDIRFFKKVLDSIITIIYEQKGKPSASDQRFEAQLPHLFLLVKRYRENERETAQARAELEEALSKETVFMIFIEMICHKDAGEKINSWNVWLKYSHMINHRREYFEKNLPETLLEPHRQYQQLASYNTYSVLNFDHLQEFLQLLKSPRRDLLGSEIELLALAFDISICPYIFDIPTRTRTALATYNPKVGEQPKNLYHNGSNHYEGSPDETAIAHYQQAREKPTFVVSPTHFVSILQRIQGKDYTVRPAPSREEVLTDPAIADQKFSGASRMTAIMPEPIIQGGGISSYLLHASSASSRPRSPVKSPEASRPLRNGKRPRDEEEASSSSASLSSSSSSSESFKGRGLAGFLPKKLHAAFFGSAPSASSLSSSSSASGQSLAAACEPHM